MEIGQVVDRLQQAALFQNASPESLDLVARSLRPRRFRRGEIVFHQGDPGDALHLVTAGAFKTILIGIDGEEAIIATLRTGDFFGELALLDGAPRSATVTSLEASETWSLPRTTLRELLDHDPALRDALLAGLARELRRLTRQVEELHFLDLAGRLAMRLARLAREQDPSGHEDPTRLALHAVRSRSDDRRDPPEREQASRRPRRPRPRHGRAGHAPHPGRGGARA